MKKICLPKLLDIKVENYSLYSQNPSFEFSFSDGISAIIGINGIGKTTLVEMIMYCLLGYKKKDSKKNKSKNSKIEYENENYFRDRMNKNYDKNKEAKVFLSFIINGYKIKIGRSLFENKILYLTINNKITNNLSEEYYEELITKLTGIADFESVEKIIRYFLFFDEQRRNIAWEADTQDEILRILLFEEKFFNRFNYLENEITRLDTLGRHTSEERKALLRSYDELIKDKQKVQNKIKRQSNQNNVDNKNDYQNLYKLQMKNNELEQERLDIQIEIEELIEIYQFKNVKLDKLIGERDNILAIIENIEHDISSIESKLYSSIYNNLPEFYIAIERTLSDTGECLVCGAKSKKLKDEAITKIKNSQCLICSSKLQAKEDFDYEMIENLNNLNSIKDEKNKILNNYIFDIKQLEKEIEQINHEIKNLNEQLNIKKYEIMHIESLISEFNSQNQSDTLSEILNDKQNRVEDLTKIINNAYKDRDELKKELKTLHNEFKKIIKKLNNNLSKYFDKYASTFLGVKCELTVKERTINKIPHILYLPVINDDVRNDIWAVSESQRFFIDQAFRMAIIDYLRESIDNFETFFITETPEGSLDISYEAKVAEMFLKFSESENNIIFTSNLNSSRFLFEIFKNIPESQRYNRILNLLEKGNITQVQDDSMPKLLEIYQDILRGD